MWVSIRSTIIILVIIVLTARAAKMKKPEHRKLTAATGKRRVSFNGITIGNSRILGGEFATQGQFPYHVNLLFQTNGENFGCGGSLISPEWVLTAAHCTNGSNNFKAYLAPLNMTNENEPHRIMVVPSQIIQHENYGYINGSLGNDIALLKLPQPVVENEYIKAIRLPGISEACLDFAGRNATLTGYGKTSNDPVVNAAAPEILKFVELTVISNRECYDSNPGLADEKLCTKGDLVKDACGGDSGGPLAVKDADNNYTQVAFVSYGPDPCADGNPGVYVRVSSHLNWIKQKTGIVLRP